MNHRKAVRAQEGIFETVSSISSLKENQSSEFSENKSKAYAAAMKALQHKLSIAELENSDLKEKIEYFESKASSIKQETESKVLEDRKKLQNLENSYILKINELEQSEKDAKIKCKHKEEAVKILEVKLKHSEDSLARASEIFNIDKENLKLEVECLTKALQSQRKQENSWKKKYESVVREKKLVGEELVQEKKMNESLREEIQFLRENSDIQRLRIEEGYECLKSEMIQKGQENMQLIKKLSIKNKSLQKIVSESKKKEEYYKGMYSKLSQRARVSQDFGAGLKKSRSKSKNFDWKLKNTDRSSTPSLKSYDSAYHSISSNIEEDEVIKAIKSTEIEVNRLGEKYKSMQIAESECSEPEVFKRNLEDLCVSIEKKNKELFRLKKKQQECLKLKLIN